MKRLLLILSILTILSLSAFAQEPAKGIAKPVSSPALSPEQKATLAEIVTRFALAKRDEEIAQLKLAVLQEQFARLQDQMREAAKCPTGTLDTQGVFTCPPKSEEKKE